MSIDNEHRTSSTEQTQSTNPTTEPRADRPFDEVVTPAETRREEEQENRHIGRNVLIGVGVVAALGGLGAFLLNQHPGDRKADAAAPPKDDHETNQTPVPSASSSPEATPITGTNEQLGTIPTGPTEIPASLSPEETGKRLIVNWNAWRNAGETDANYKAAFNDQAGFDAFSQSVAKKETAIFADDLFAPDWQSRPDLEDYAANYMEGNNEVTIRSWIATYKEHPHFKWTATLDSTELLNTNSGTNSETLDVKFTQHTNAKDFPNNGAISQELSQFDDIKEEMVVTLQNLGGTERVTAINQKDIQ